MESRRLIIIGILVFVFAETGSTPMFGRAPYPGDFTEGTELTRPKREGTNVELSHGERLQDPRSERAIEGLSRVKRIDTEPSSRIKRETLPVSPTGDRRGEFISKRKEITEQHEDWQDAKANRKRMNMHRETEAQQTRDMTSFSLSSKDIRWQKFERDVRKRMPRPFRQG